MKKTIYTSVRFPAEWADDDRREESIKEIAEHLINGSEIVLKWGSYRHEFVRNFNDVVECLFDEDHHLMDAQLQSIAIGSNDVNYLRKRIMECAEKVADEIIDLLIDQVADGIDIEEVNTLKESHTIKIEDGASNEK